MKREAHTITGNDRLLGGLLILCIAAVGVWGARGGSGTVWLFPRQISILLVVCGGLLILQGLRRPERVRLWQSPKEARDVLIFISAVVLYVSAVAWVGFWLVTGLLIGGAAHALSGGGRVLRLVGWLVVGLALGLAMDALFVGVFEVPLPGGRLWNGATWRWWLP